VSAVKGALAEHNLVDPAQRRANGAREGGPAPLQ
jgi:hypothetical protein